MIKAVTFDLDGVYFPDGKQQFLAGLEHHYGVTEDDAKRVFFNSDEMNQQYKRGRMTDDEFFTWAANEWHIQASPAELIELLIAGYTVDARVRETVKAVRRLGVKTCICTNNFPARIDGLQKKFGFLDDFDVKVLSYEVGCIKPTREIFEALVALSAVQPSEIMYADDSPEAIESARQVGLQALVYEDFDSFQAELRSGGVNLPETVY